MEIMTACVSFRFFNGQKFFYILLSYNSTKILDKGYYPQSLDVNEGTYSGKMVQELTLCFTYKLLGPAGLCFLRWLRIIREMRNISMYASNLGVLDSSPCPAPSELLLVAIETSDPVELLLQGR